MTAAESAIQALPAAARASLPDRLAAVFDASIQQLRAAGVAIDARASLAALVAEIVRDATARALNPFGGTSSRSEAQWIERPIFVAPPSPPASFSALLARARSAAAAAVSAVVSPAGAPAVPYSPALIAAVTRGGAAAQARAAAIAALGRSGAAAWFDPATARVLDNVPASVRDFSNAVRRAREVQDAEKRSRVMKIGAAVVGGLALVFFLRGRK
jgi:hypothetical protein